MENGQFAQQADVLQVGFQNTTHYNYVIQLGAGGSNVEHHARPVGQGMKAYVGMTAVVLLPSSEVASQTIICESDSYVPQAATPLYNVSDIACAPGTRSLD